VTSLPMGGAASRFETSSPPRMWEGWSRPRKTREARYRKNLRERREQEKERRAEAAALGAAHELGPGESNRCSYPHPLLWYPQTRSRRWICFPFFFPWLSDTIAHVF